MAIKAGIFDLGKTVIDYDWDRALRILKRTFGVEAERFYGTIVHGDAYEGLESSLYNGCLSPNEFYRASVALLRRKEEGRWPSLPPKQITEEQFWEIFNAIFAPNPPMEKLIPVLKKRGYRLVLLTNTCAPHFEFIRSAFRVMDHFDAAVVSHELRLKKPDPRIYQHAVSAAGAKPEECFFVDDLEANLAYPLAIGIRTFRYRIDDHDALLAWLSREGIL